MELPRGRQYWDNHEVKFMIEGTGSIIHDFDGCCFGLRQKFGVSNMYIKKRWRISSWNVGIGNRLSLRCDGRHEHAPCAGREKHYTPKYTQAKSRRSFCKNSVQGVGFKKLNLQSCMALVQAGPTARNMSLLQLA